MGHTCAVTGTGCCRVFTATDPDQISTAKLKVERSEEHCGEEGWSQGIADKSARSEGASDWA
jgi:hypothetical protein